MLHAVGNIVAEDFATLHDQGFAFDIVKYHSDSEVVTIRYRVPEEFHFTGAMGMKPFQGVSFYEPTNKADREARLIAAAGTRFNLLVEKQDKKFHGQFSLIKDDAKNKYLEFHFNQGSGYPPMLIHVPLKLLVDLQK